MADSRDRYEEPMTLVPAPGFFDELAGRLARGPAAVATVVRATGSTPRQAGTRMGLAGDDAVWGTVGGGVAEAHVLEVARSVLESTRPEAVDVDLTGTLNDVRAGVCGGRMEVWIHHLNGEVAREIAAAIAARLAAGRTARVLVGRWSPALMLEESGPWAAAAADCWVEELAPEPLLLIVGAGHIGMELARVAAGVGFQVAVQDDRAEWADPARFPRGSRMFSCPLSGVLAALDWAGPLYVALVTRGFRQDVEALRVLLTAPPVYLGLLGSRHRLETVREALSLEGMPPERWNETHAPIGMEIGAETPAEIAVSICAELIAVRRRGDDYARAV